MADQKTIAFFPEGAFGPALNNATRVQETNHGLKMHRADWRDEALAAALDTLINDRSMHEKLAATRAHMQSQDGTQKAARLLDGLLK